MREQKDKGSRMQSGEWTLRVRSRTGGIGSVHYGTQAEIEWYANAARRRGDEIEEHCLMAAAAPAEDHLQ
jgi:hypothetical protein